MSIPHELYSPSKNSLDKALAQCKWRNIYFDCYGKGHPGINLHETIEKAQQGVEESVKEGEANLKIDSNAQFTGPPNWFVRDYRWAIQIPIMEGK